VFDVAGLIRQCPDAWLIVRPPSFFSGLLFLFFEFTIQGKALRHGGEPHRGAAGRHQGRHDRDDRLLAGLAARRISGAADRAGDDVSLRSGFLIGPEAFVGAIFGAMASYPVTALGAVLVGLLESFASFWSSAYKEVVVFGLLIPSCLAVPQHGIDDEEEAEE